MWVCKTIKVAKLQIKQTNKQIYIFWNTSIKTNHSELCGVAKKERPIGVGHSSHDFLIWYETQANAKR